MHRLIWHQLAHDGNAGGHWTFTAQKMPEWTQLTQYQYASRLASFENNPYFTMAKPPANYIHAAYKVYVQVNTAQLPEGWSRALWQKHALVHLVLVAHVQKCI